MTERAAILDRPDRIDPYVELFCRLAEKDGGRDWERKFLSSAAGRLLILNRSVVRALVSQLADFRNDLDLAHAMRLAPLADAVLDEQFRRGDVTLESPLVFLERRDDPVAALRLAEATMAKARRAHGSVPARPAWRWHGGRLLRIGYVVSDLAMHPVGLSIRSMILRHNRDRFQVYVYDRTPEPERAVQGPVELGADRFRRVADLAPADVRRIIVEDGVDILIDLSGAPLDIARDVFCLNPAPVVVAMIGYPGAIGAATVDYYIADRTVVPSAERAGFSEHLVYMPASFLAVDDQVDDPAPPPRSALGLPENTFVMAAFNRFNKLNLATLRLWFTCLRRIPNAVLWVAKDRFAGDASLLRLAAQAGIAPGRIVVAERENVRNHRARMAAADIALDPLGYNGGFTTALALYRGVPVVSLPGRCFAWRMSASLLAAAGLADCIAESPADYFAKVESFAREPDRLAACRARLARRPAGGLFDAKAYVVALETALKEIARRRRDGRPDGDIDVAALQANGGAR